MQGLGLNDVASGPSTFLPSRPGGSALKEGGEEKLKEGVFLWKLSRTVFIDNLSLKVNEGVLTNALAQFGDVMSVHIVKDALDPTVSCGCALVEMGSPDQAANFVMETEEKLFMIGTMPRPVSASLARREMFDNPPPGPAAAVQIRPRLLPLGKGGVGPPNSDSATARKRRRLAQQHEEERQMLLEMQRKEREALHNEQESILGDYQQKHRLIDRHHHGILRLKDLYETGR
eukprot:jgi/Mesen1/5525/ME000279S04738